MKMDRIVYLCPECKEILNLSGFKAVNEVGRKSCEGCGSNENNLIVVGIDKYNEAVDHYNSMPRNI